MRALTRNRAVVGLLCFVAAFLVGRHFYFTGNDFNVYHTGLRNMLSGRVDLYSSRFAFPPPMVYVYPPLFLLLIFPLGWLDLENAFGLCFALMALALIVVVRMTARQWRPESRWMYAATIVLLAGPYATLCFRSGNVHLFVALLLVSAFVAWSKDRLWWASAAVALGGAIKIFPLFLLPVFAVRRDWTLVWRTVALTILLWSLPVVFFGPRRTVELYREWFVAVGGDFEAFKQQRALDLSLPGVLGRWMAPVDYSRYVDPGYPQVNVVTLSTRTVRGVVLAIVGALCGLSLWMCARLRRAASSRPRDIAAVSAIFVTAMLLAGPYTPIQHMSALLVAAMTLSVALGSGPAGRWLVVLALVNALLFVVQGSANQRALQASGAFTLIGLSIWGLSMFGGHMLTRRTARTATSLGQSVKGGAGESGTRMENNPPLPAAHNGSVFGPRVL